MLDLLTVNLVGEPAFEGQQMLHYEALPRVGDYVRSCNKLCRVVAVIHDHAHNHHTEAVVVVRGAFTEEVVKFSCIN